MYQYWQIEQQGEHAQLTLQAPPVNALSAEVLAELAEAVTACEQQGVRTLLISSAVAGFFSAGADLKMLRGGSAEQAQALTEAFKLGFSALRDFHGVSLALIEGRALGGGLELALACDLRITTPQASWGLPEARLGLLPCAGATQLLPRLVGLGRAKRMILTGEPISGYQAEQSGLADACYRPLQARENALRWLANIRKAEPGALLACKHLLEQAHSQPLNQGYAVESKAFIRLFAQQAPAQGVEAFFAREAPPWHRE